VLVAPDVALTALHTVGGDDDRSIEVRFHDDEWRRASVIATDAATDLALLAVAADGRQPATLRSSTDLGAGDPIIAIGNPREMAFSVSRGVVAYVGREMDSIRYLQTDLTVNPGNSGGPIFDERGHVVGIMSFVLRDTTGVAFAIPVDYAAERFPELVRLDGPRSTPSRSSGS
jgi:serine protease Do